jgi:hypothetical protein
MAKVFSSGKNKAKQDDEQKLRKKRAKREAKLMAQVDQAKKDVRRAEQKATKAQTTLQEQQTRLQKLEQELTQFRQAGQVDPTDMNQSTDGLQTSSSLSTEGRNDIGAAATAGSAVNTTDEADTKEIQLPSPAPAEGRTDIAKEDPISTPEATSTSTNTPIEGIPAGQFDDEEPSAQVHADISINPTPTEEDLAISSGDGSIPVVTTDEHAWPPPEIREELAESIAEETTTATGKPATTSNDQSKAPANAQEQAFTGDGQDAAEENFAITSGDGSIPVITTDEHAWPPPHIREELAESIAEEVKQEHQTADNKQGESDTSSMEEEAESHEDEHEEGSTRPRRTTRRRTRSNTHSHTNKTDQE